MLASRVITDYKGRTIQRIFIFPQTRPCKKAWAFALRQVGYRATGKYRNYKIRRAKKMIYRLEHQSCKQDVASDIEGTDRMILCIILPCYLLICSIVLFCGDLSLFP